MTEAPGGISRKQHTQTSPAAAARIVASNFWAGVNSITVPRASSGADIRYGLDLAGPISVATGSPAKETGAGAADADIRYANGPPEGRRARRGADGGTGSERYH